MLNELDKLSTMVPELYNDAFKPSAQELGKTAALIPQVINAALLPVYKWVAHQEFNLTKTKKLLEIELANVDAKKITPPEPHVAVPALLAISYSMDNEELRKLYANLLAKAMHEDFKNAVHPSFVEIIKQLSPHDSLIFKEISLNRPFPIATLSASEYSSSPTSARIEYYVAPIEPPITHISIQKITPIDFLDHDSTSISIDNLTRLGLIEIGFNIGNKTDPRISNTLLYNKSRVELEKYISNNNWRYQETNNTLNLTNFGLNFYNICVKSF